MDARADNATQRRAGSATAAVLGSVAGFVVGQSRNLTFSVVGLIGLLLLVFLFGTRAPTGSLISRVSRASRAARFVIVAPSALLLVAVTTLAYGVAARAAITDRILASTGLIKAEMERFDNAIQTGDLPSAEAARSTALAALGGHDVPDLPQEVQQLAAAWEVRSNQLAEARGREIMDPAEKLIADGKQLEAVKRLCGSDPSAVVRAHLKRTANDPPSVEGVSCITLNLSKDSCYSLSCEFREKNRAGALVLRQGHFRVWGDAVTPVGDVKDVAQRP